MVPSVLPLLQRLAEENSYENGFENQEDKIGLLQGIAEYVQKLCHIFFKEVVHSDIFFKNGFKNQEDFSLLFLF